MIRFVDTHAHLDGEEFDADREEVIGRAKEAGCRAIFLPAIDVASSHRILQACRQHEGFLFPMLGLHPEEVRADWQEQLRQIRRLIDEALGAQDSAPKPVLAIGEVGLDYYWSREFEHEQLLALEQQIEWAIELRLPLMIHCRKAQNELVRLLRHYERELPGGVFHCFTGNALEAAELLQFPGFALGIGGVLTFKKSHLPEVLPQAVPLGRLVLETDAPYMAPVPYRGQRNESAYIRQMIARLAESYAVSEEAVCAATNENVERIFGVKI